MADDDTGESGFIKRLGERIRVSREEVAVAIGDDAAVIRKRGGGFLLVASDMLLEDVHFTRRMTFPRIGHKALAVNLSDIAAMGGEPLYCLVSLGLPGDMTPDDAHSLYEGIIRTAGEYGVDIIGGDTNLSRSGLVVDICIIGEADERSLCLRSGAKPGDWIMLTGTAGHSALTLSRGACEPPRPRVREAKIITGECRPTAMIDLSDGLAKDLNSICDASGTGAEVRAGAVPVAEGATLEMALAGGEDYELLFTVNPRDGEKLVPVFREKTGLRLSHIGEITGKDRGVLISGAGGAPRPLGKGYEHF